MEEDRSSLPTLKAIILDFRSVNNIDVTSIQNLIDVRNQLDRYTAPEVVQWHIACINNRWTKRALASAGFGYPTLPAEEYHRWKPIFSVAEIGGSSSAAAAAEIQSNLHQRPTTSRSDIEAQRNDKPVVLEDNIDKDSSNSSEDLDLQKEISGSKAYSRPAVGTKKIAVVHALNRPLFHIDLTSALQSAIANLNNEQHTKGVGTEIDA
jgi:sodium-independent sulfate anion transporter 11